MSTAKAVLDETQYVKVNSGYGAFIIQSHRDTVRIAFSDVKPARDNQAFHELGGAGKESILYVPDTKTDIWVLALSNHSSLTITDQYVPSVQYPLPTDGDSVYCKDIWIEQSDTTNWLRLDGAQEDAACTPFTNLHTRIQNSTTDNPKVLLIHFNRSVRASEIGLGCTGGGDFSNVKIDLIGSGGVTRTAVDDSTNNTKYTSRNFDFTNQVFNAVRFTFSTADAVCLSNITIPKSTSVSVSQVEPTTDSLKMISYSHAELHSGSHYVSRGFTILGNGGVQEILVVTPDTTRWEHVIFSATGEDGEIEVELFEGTVTSDDGVRNNERNRNRNFPDNNTTLVYYNPTVTSDGDSFSPNRYGSGKDSGGGARDSEEILLRQNTKYLFRITNVTVSNNTVNWVIDWYEHTNKNII